MQNDQIEKIVAHIVQGVCELQEIPDPDLPSTIIVSEADLEAVVTNRLTAALSLPESFKCGARQQGTAGGNDPADCNWPLCGCDPYADKVIVALQESGHIAEQGEPQQAEEPVAWLRFGSPTPIQGVPLGAIWITDESDLNGFPVYARPLPQEPVVSIDLMQRIWANLYFDEDDVGSTFQRTLNDVVDWLTAHHSLPEVPALPSLSTTPPQPDTFREEVRKVLEPFAKLADNFIDDDHMPTKRNENVVWGYNNSDLTYGHFRAARDLLARLSPTATEGE